MENINIYVKKKKQQALFFIIQPSLASLSGNTVTWDPLLPPPPPSSQSPVSLLSNVMFSFSVHQTPSLQNAAPSLGGRKPARHPETAGVDTFRLQVTRCCLNAHLSETSPSPIGRKNKRTKKRKEKKKLPKNQPQRNEQENPFNDSIKRRY